MNKDLFGFGASSLANDVLMQLEKQSGNLSISRLFFKRLIMSNINQKVVGVMLVQQRIQIILC